MICDECETVAHCLKNGCVPKQPSKDEALKLALDALNTAHLAVEDDMLADEIQQAITAIKQTLAAPMQEPVQEPVGVFVEDDDIGHVRLIPHQQLKLKDGDKLYTTPPAAQPAPVQEPVAWMWKDMRGQDVVSLFEPRLNPIPLYTTPPAQPASVQQSRSDVEPVQEPVGNWIWSWLMDWCKRNGIAPATQDSLFAMVSDARSKFESAPPAHPTPEQYAALEQALTRLQKRYGELEAKVAAQPAPDYAWPTIADYEKDVGFPVNQAFKSAWAMARTTNALFTQMMENT